MRALVPLILIPFVAAIAQHTGTMSRGTEPGRSHAGIAAAPSSPDRFRRAFAPRSRFRRPFFPAGLPFLLGDYEDGYSPYSPAPSVVVIEQPPAYFTLPQAPMEPPKSEIYEYKNGAEDRTTPSEGDSPAFAIVLRDGSVDSAIGVTLQENMLHYVQPEGGHRTIPLDAIDRQATRRLNRERGLDLQLPPASR